MGGTGQDMGWGREERATAPKLQFLSPPLVGLSASCPVTRGSSAGYQYTIHYVLIYY